MRKNKCLRKVLCIFFLVCLLMNLVACADTKKGEKTESAKEKTNFTKEYIEIPMDLSLLEEDGWENSIIDVKRQNDRYYILALKKKEEERKQVLFSMDKEGASPEVVELESLPSNVGFFYAGTIGSDGMVYTLKRVNEGNRVAETIAESWDIPKHYVLSMRDFTGALKVEVDLTEQTDDEGWENSVTLLADQNGPMVLFESEGNVKTLRIGKDGKVSDTVNVEGAFGAPERFFISNTDQICQMQEDTEKGRWQIAFFNSEFQLEEKKNLPYSFVYSGNTSAKFEMLGEDQLIFANEQSAKDYTWEEQRALEVLDLSVVGSYVKEWKGLFSDDDGRLYIAYVDSDDVFVFNQYREPDQSEVIRVAWLPNNGSYRKSLFKKKVMEFNKTHSDCRIVLDNYGLLMSEPDYEDPNFDYTTYYQELRTSYQEAIVKINADIAAGNSPDIFCCDDFEWEPYIKKGMLADIGELMAQDEEISQLEYLDNVLEACKIDGKLYMAIPSFYVYTMIGKQSIVGNRTYWTLDEMMEVIRSKEGVEYPFGFSLDGVNFLKYCYIFNTNHYVDKATGQCYFDSEEFKEMMEFAKTIQPDRSLVGADSGSVYDQYKNEKYLLSLEMLYDFGFSTNKWYTVFKEPISYVGFPTSGECGSMIVPLDTMVINELSPHKKEAWLFVREFLMEDWQTSYDTQFPMLRTVFLDRADFTYEDMGKNDYSMILSGGLHSDDVAKVECVPQEEWDRYLEFLQSVNYSMVEVDSQICKIIEEEAPTYLNGFRGLDETATIIQNRVTLYLQENK